MIPEFIEQIANNTNMPFISSFFIGLATAISPCTFAANVAAISYIAHDANNPSKALYAGFLFSIGRIVTYFVIGAIMISAGQVVGSFARDTQTYGNMVIGPVLIFIGLWFAGLFEFDISFGSNLTQRFSASLSSKGGIGALLLGMLFAFAFCPYSGMLFFGLLMPLAISSSSGIVFPIIFGIGVNVPVIIFAILLYVSMTKARMFGKALTSSWTYLGKIIGWIIVATGCYYVGPYMELHWGIHNGFYILLSIFTIILVGKYYYLRTKTDEGILVEQAFSSRIEEKSIKEDASSKEVHHTSFSSHITENKSIEKELELFFLKLANASPEDYFSLKREFDVLEESLIKEGILDHKLDEVRECRIILMHLLDSL